MKNIDKFLYIYVCFLLVSLFIVLNTNTAVAQECTQNSDCPVTGICITEQYGKTYNECVECTNDAHCSGITRKCAVKSNQRYNKCVECIADNDCRSGQHCEKNMCYVCYDDSHCSGQYGACLRNRTVQEGRCVECAINSHCKFDQMCDPSTYTCKAKIQEQEPQIDPDKYQIDRYKGKSPKKLDKSSPELQQKYKNKELKQQQQIEQYNTKPKKPSPKDIN
jgi:hypothetical protein